MTIRDTAVGQYLVITAGYWAFTITDGALRMLVVLYFHNLGYSPLEVATLFLMYEFFGIVTNLFGGWLAARIGLNITMHIGLGLQVVSLLMLLVEQSLLTVLYVMIAQALSGIAKDLNKMSAKSSIKMLVKDGADGRLYQWVAVLTGSKNALKGGGFFIGAALLATLGFSGAVALMAGTLAAVLSVSYLLLNKDLGKTSYRPRFTDLMSKSPAVNRLSLARFFLFASRDVWFVVALPVFLQSQLGWSHIEVGALLAAWIIGYGVVQALAPVITKLGSSSARGDAGGSIPDGRTALLWSIPLCVAPALIVALLPSGPAYHGLDAGYSLVIGLLIFGVLFAINSSVHSYLIVAYAKQDGVSLDVGYYYMANAAGRLFGTVLSGWLYQTAGLAGCLLLSSVLIASTSVISTALPKHQGDCPQV